MLIRWLLLVFPRELKRAWRRLAANAFVWCAIAGIVTALPYLQLLAGPAVGEDADRSVTAARTLATILAFLRVATAPVVFVVAAARFSSSETGHRSWSGVGRLVARRTIPALAAWLGASAIALIVSAVAQWAVITVLSEMEGAKQALAALSTACRIFIYVSLMARFAFVPFIAALEHRDGTIPQKPPARGPVERVAYVLAWPLFESWGRSQALAWRLFPFVLLVIYAPVAAGFVWAAVRAPASFFLQLLSFAALAVLFDYYSGASQRPACEQPGS